MQKIIVIAAILFLVSINTSFAQRQRRSDKTSSGKAAYGVATVSNGKVKKVKKTKSEKALKRKTRAAKAKPSYRKKTAWAG